MSEGPPTRGLVCATFPISDDTEVVPLIRSDSNQRRMVERAIHLKTKGVERQENIT